MNSLRRILYCIARLLGDFNALVKGKIGSRLVNKLMGRKLVSRAWLRGGCLLPAVGLAAAVLWAVMVQ